MAYKTLAYRGYEITLRRNQQWEAHIFRMRRDLPSPRNQFGSSADTRTAIVLATRIVDTLLTPERKRYRLEGQLERPLRAQPLGRA